MLMKVRASSLSSYADCPRRWAARNLKATLERAGYAVRYVPGTIGAAIGSGTHTAAADMLTAKMEHGRIGSLSRAVEAGIDELERRIGEDGVAYDDVSRDLPDAQLQVRRLSRAYRDHVGRRVSPIAVERRLEAVHSSGLTLSGQQDLVVAEPATLRDLKTGKRMSANFAQYGAYSRLLRSHENPVKRIIEDYVPRVSLRMDQPDPVSKPYDIKACETAAESVLTLISINLARFEARGNPDPIGAFVANPQSMMCSDKLCPAHSTLICPYGRGRQ